MGLLDEYGLDVSEYDAPGFEVPDGVYEFVVGDYFIKNGSAKNPDKAWVIMEYTLDTGKKFSELWELPADMSNLTEAEKDKMGRLNQRLQSLGLTPEQAASADRDDVVGISGSFQLRSSVGKKGGTFQNIRNLRVYDSGENEFEEAEEAPVKAATKAPAAKRIPSKAATTVSNPFAKKG